MVYSMLFCFPPFSQGAAVVHYGRDLHTSGTILGLLAFHLDNGISTVGNLAIG